MLVAGLILHWKLQRLSWGSGAQDKAAQRVLNDTTLRLRAALALAARDRAMAAALVLTVLNAVMSRELGARRSPKSLRWGLLVGPVLSSYRRTAGLMTNGVCMTSALSSFSTEWSRSRKAYSRVANAVLSDTGEYKTEKRKVET